MSSSPSSAETVSTCCDSDSTMSTTSSSSSEYYSAVSSVSCHFNPTTCKRQSFLIPDKIVYYIAKNPTNGKTFRKLIQTCKYFFKINPVIVVYLLECYGGTWYAYYDEDEKSLGGIKYGQQINAKIWVTEFLNADSGNASKVIPLIYKNDATNVSLQNGPFKFDDLLLLTGNAEKLFMWNQIVKYDDGKTVQLEDIVKNLPKLKILEYDSHFNGGDVNSDTVTKLMEIEHFKHLSRFHLYKVSEAFDVEGMFNFIIDNKHIKVELWYRSGISEAYEQLVREYSNLLQKENGCNSRILLDAIDTPMLNSEDDISVTSFESFDDASDDDENKDFLFPWKNKDDEEWELPWDKE